MPLTRLLFLLAAFAGTATSVTGRLDAAELQSPIPADEGSCEAEARFGGGASGCFWLASINLGPMPQQLYWHVDRFSDVASAEAARSIYGRVTVTLGGHVFLQTVSDNPAWTAPGGERLATIGPLPVQSGSDLVARFMETTIPAGVEGPGRTTAGPEALFVLGGSLCVETPAGAQDIAPRGSLVVPAGVPKSRAAREAVQALALVVHPAAEGWTRPPPGWTASGLCRG
jgi:quercetin dioxygenase-like cupin family protein